MARENLPCPFTSETRTRAPHDITDQSVLEDYPRGPGSDVLCELMAASIGVFRGSPGERGPAGGWQAAGD